MIDATVIRAHLKLPGARRKKGGSQAQALGRSRVGSAPSFMLS